MERLGVFIIGMLVGVSVCGAFVGSFFFFYDPELPLSIYKVDEKYIDAISVAGQLGRLDLVSLSLGTIGAAVAFGAIFGFLHIKDHSRVLAKETAEDTVKELWGEYKRERLPQLVATQIRDITNIVEQVSDKTAKDIAEIIGSGDGDGDGDGDGKK